MRLALRRPLLRPRYNHDAQASVSVPFSIHLHRFLLVAAISLCVPALNFAQSADEPADESGETAATSRYFADNVQPFLRTYCVECHGPATHEADLRLDTLSADFDAVESARAWSHVRDKLSGAKMPPADARQPEAAESIAVAHWIYGELGRAAQRARRGAGRVVLRRLNRVEYNNTIRDLVGVDFQPAADFPADPPAFGFVNVGAALDLSPVLLEKYLAAAREIVDRAIVVGRRPPSFTWRMEVDEGHRSHQFSGRQSAGDDELWVRDLVYRDHRYIVRGGGVDVREGFIVLKGSKDESGAGFRWFRVPVTGDYRLRVRAAGVIPTRAAVVESARRIFLEHLDGNDWKDLSEPERQRRREAWLREDWPGLSRHLQTEAIYDYGPPRMKVVADDTTPIGELSVEAPPETPQVYEFRTRLTAIPGETVGVELTNSYHVPRSLENWFRDDPRFARTELWIDWVEIEGPFFDDWPPASHQAILFDSPRRGDDLDYAREVLARFAARAFRRPVGPEELRPYVELFASVRPHRESFEEAIKAPLTALLVSPHFLFLVEPSAADATRPLSDHEIAARLSYFLWSTMPDDELFEWAGDGRLRDPQALRTQVDRMLADPRSRQFVEQFTSGWLGLGALGANRPVETLFPRYDPHLEQSMLRESQAFFAEILDNDLSALNFIRSDFVTINQRLARFYEIPGVEGDEFRRVPVDARHHRGGLLTQASILTVTSNGTRTSPVVRGTWILENLLGDPPPPPPPDAGDLAPSVPGIDKATVRDRLAAHRRIAQCAACHDKIDPLGFALENFDAHGRWRDQYGFGYEGAVDSGDPDVDARAVLPGGEAIDGVAGLQAALAATEDAFLGCLVEKLLVYALGRTLEPVDEPLVERLVAELKANGYSLRTAIQGVVASEAFLDK